ncbi:MAG: LD-carboxypeptidase [Barnesiella sp.]|nr:LD-carboxypeptidase [Barnesiella sp.]
MYISDRPAIIESDRIVTPPSLRPGDMIAIVTPASAAPGYDYSGMVRIIESMGYNAYVAPHARGRSGSYSGTKSQRLSDLSEALTNPEVRAIICTRGGYGAIHLLDDLDELPLADDPKWIVGFSDISALHALMQRHGIASLHAPMGCNLKYHSGELSPSVKAMFAMLEGKHATYEINHNSLNRNGETMGTLVGGNLAVLDGLISTRFDVIRPNTILFIEDVAEPVYKIERQLYRLKLSGVLENLAGLIVGDFTETHGDENYRAMEIMIRDMVKDYDYPVAFGVPAGHARVNIPLILGAPVMLEVSDEGTTITQ